MDVSQHSKYFFSVVESSGSSFFGVLAGGGTLVGFGLIFLFGLYIVESFSKDKNDWQDAEIVGEDSDRDQHDDFDFFS